jgi:two-component system, cell cycle sensor histidine kinase and response regulator CckA
MKTSFGRARSGCPIQAVALFVLLGSLRLSATNSDPPWPEPGAFFAFVPPLAVVYVLCAMVLSVMVMGAVRWAKRWQGRTLRQHNQEVLQLLDKWTKRLQQEVAAREQAERTMQETHERDVRQERLAAVGRLTAGLAHQFNNIMTIVEGHASLLMDNPNLDEESAKSLVYITKSVERMAKLIQQLLAFSRKQLMQPKPLDVGETLAQTSGMLSRLLGQDVALRLEINPHLPPILADWEMFQQIMANLVTNGRDAMRGGGLLTIGAAEANFNAAGIPTKSERQAGRFVRLSVTDTGCGMDSAVIDHLYEPFFTTKEVGKGAGLGLATVHGMIHQHQGWVEVESKAGQGTTFHLYFPVTAQAPQRKLEASQPVVRGGQETVLVVEDEKVLRELVREILTAYGYGILEAADGVEALQVWEKRQEEVDLLLTDVSMPRGLSGRDVAEKLRQDDPGLPVIFSSGYSQEMMERSDDTVQGVTYLSKPYLPAQLAQAVRHALDSAPKGGAAAAKRLPTQQQ